MTDVHDYLVLRQSNRQRKLHMESCNATTYEGLVVKDAQEGFGAHSCQPLV